MRDGGWHAVQQALAAEVAAAVRQGVGLARRQGHTKVTPLHVASSMLSVGAGPLRAACLRCRSHPLQCEALELCFVVALDRLPAAGVFRRGSHAPAVSNALVAAVKRAKAQLVAAAKRAKEQLNVKVGLEQFVISILDDPGVSRVMQEAGFSSSEVKADVEKAVSLDHPDTTVGRKNSPDSKTAPDNSNSSHTAKLKESTAEADDDDAMRVLDCLASGRKQCTVTVGESAEGVARVVMDKVSKAELQHQHVPADNVVASSLRRDSDHEGQSSKALARPRTGCPAFGGGTAAVDSKALTATASIPPWLRRFQDPVPTPASCGGTTLQLQYDLSNNWNSSPAAASFFAGFTHCNTTLNSKPWQPWPYHGRHDHAMPKAYYDQRSYANPNCLEPNTVCKSSDASAAEAARRQPKFTELTAENLKVLCNALDKGATRHKDVVPDVAITVLQCRSGMSRRREKPSSATWLLFQGRDSCSKKAVAQELANLVFGSLNQVNSSTSFIVELTLKRQGSPYNEPGFVERLHKVICENPHRVIMIENIEHLDYDSEIIIKNAIADGRMSGCNGDEISLEDAIIVLSCETFDSKPMACCPGVKHMVSSHGSKSKKEAGIEGEAIKLPCFSLDLNVCSEDTGEDPEEESSLNDARMLNTVDGVFFFPLINVG